MEDVEKGISFLPFLGVLRLDEDTEPIVCIISSYWKSGWY